MRTAICELFGVRHPIVQTGMGFVSGAKLTAATANAGGLGILASATMTKQALEQEIRQTKELTSEPFGVNLRADAADVLDRIARPGACDIVAMGDTLAGLHEHHAAGP